MKKYILLLILLAAVVAIPIMAFLGTRERKELRSRAAPATRLSLEPALASFPTDQSFNVEVKVETGGNQLVSADIILNYSPAILEGLSITQGSFLPNITEIRKTIDNTNGKIIYSFFTTSENAKSGEGVLASVSFKGKAEGGTSVTFDSETAIYGLGEGQNVLVGTTPGEYTITTSISPTPSTTIIPTETPTPLPTPKLGYVVIHPGRVYGVAQGAPVGLSTLAYDEQWRPIWSGITYEWGISSASSVGTLSPLLGNITNFQPLNPGTGDIFVVARQENYFVVGGVLATVAAIPTIEPTQTTTPSPSVTTTPIPSPTQTIPTSLPPSPIHPCYEKAQRGDYDCNERVEETDFTQWLKDFLQGQTSLSFFEYWRRAFYK